MSDEKSYSLDKCTGIEHTWNTDLSKEVLIVHFEVEEHENVADRFAYIESGPVQGLKTMEEFRRKIIILCNIAIPGFFERDNND